MIGDSISHASAVETPYAARLCAAAGMRATIAAMYGPSTAIISQVAASGSQNRMIVELRSRARGSKAATLDTIGGMNIGIIGAGHIGATAARLFIDAGHHVAISNSRGPETLRELVAELGPNARAVTVEEAARFGEVVLLAIPLKDYVTLPADALRGTIAIDAMNYYPGRDGRIAPLDSGEKTSSELVAAQLPGARVVKAFNTIWFEHLRTKGNKSAPIGQRRVIPISGDDAEAKTSVARLIEEIGFGAYDLGSLAASGEQQPDTAIYNRDVTVDEARAIVPR